MSQNEQTTRFADAYATLKRCADEIENAAEDDLDTVIASVEKARQAKAICDERIQAANQKLAALLGGASGTERAQRKDDASKVATTTQPAKASKGHSTAEFDDDDIPF